MRQLVSIVAWLLPLIAACGGPDKPAEHPVVKMAPFDLDCPKDQIKYTHIDDGVWGAAGCGKRTKYVQDCREMGLQSPWTVHEECRWIQNGGTSISP